MNFSPGIPTDDEMTSHNLNFRENFEKIHFKDFLYNLLMVLKHICPDRAVILGNKPKKTLSFDRKCSNDYFQNS